MRLKKGFTLAEILIVLMVIGVIATMTVPSMMKGVAESQLKAGYKKAYNTISNFAAMERVAGTLPNRASAGNINALYTALNNSLSVKAYGTDTLDSGTIVTAASANCLTLANNGGTLGTEGNGACASVTVNTIDAGGVPTDNSVGWLVTEDNIAYAVIQGRASDTNALTKQQIAAQNNDTDASGVSSAIVIVDVNGLAKGPNTFETQGLSAALDNTSPIDPMDTVTGDRFKIYLGSDGATAGPREETATGRIAADLK